MKKTTTIITAAVATVIVIAAGLWFGMGEFKAQTVPSVDPLNATYIIEGHPIRLANGKSTIVTPGPKDPTDPTLDTTMTTTIFGQPVVGDLNGDGNPDAALFITQDTGGSGTFFYVAAAISTKDGTKGSNAIFIGDRIAPQGIQIQNSEILADYADRKPDQSFSTSPSVGITKYLKVDSSMTLVDQSPATTTSSATTTVSSTIRTPSSSLNPANPIVGAGAHCGGNMMNAPVCATGYQCTPAAGSHLPFGDVGGTCIAN